MTSATAVDWVTDTQGFSALAGEWDALLPGDARPFDLHCWYAAWWEAFGGSGELAVCTLRRGDELVGALPLLRDGRALRALANGHSPVFRPLARDGEAMEELMAAAMSGDAAQLELIALPAADAFVGQLETGAGDTPMKLLVEPSYASPIVETGGEFAAWRESSKPRWGAPLERFRRKMGRDFEAELSIVERPQDLEAELEAGFAVEASGWKGEAGTAIVSRPDTEAFYRRIAEAFHARDELRLSRIVLDGDQAAFDFCLLHRGRLYLLKTGFDERFRKLAPGLVMRLSIVERCFELGLEAHELLGEESEWKAKFATGKRAHVSATAYAKGPVGSARRLYRGAARPMLKRGYRRLRPSRR
jgi:CelD/BcsL family acetyltransferase involved in cellulose biosynthesis